MGRAEARSIGFTTHLCLRFFGSSTSNGADDRDLERQQWGQDAPFRGGCKSTRSIAAQTGEPAPTSIATAQSALGDTLHSDSLCYLLVGYAIYPPTRHLAVKVRLFIDFL